MHTQTRLPVLVTALVLVQVSRGFGNFDYPGFICEPQVSRVDAETATSEFLLIASAAAAAAAARQLAWPGFPGPSARSPPRPATAQVALGPPNLAMGAHSGVPTSKPGSGGTHWGLTL